MGFLADLVDRIRRDLDERPLDESALLARALTIPPARDLASALRDAVSPAVIAEVKRASPSAGDIADRDPAAQAAIYQEAGAAAVSVLTEPRHFGGTLADLRAARSAVSIPVLRKDFLVHPSQVIESRAAGADAVLLITAALPGRELEAMLASATDLGLGALVETHSDDDLDRAIEAGADVVGVNARDLESLEVDLEAALERIGRIPGDRVRVFESGIGSRRDVVRAAAAGASAILVGETLMRAGDPGAQLRALRGEEL